MSFTTRRLALLLTALLALHAPASRAAPGPGDVPPPDVGHTLDGDEILLPAYAGKAVVVTFWATWCPYCLKELPILENLQEKVGKDQIEVIAINTEKREVFRRATRLMSKGMQLEFVSDADGRAQQAFCVAGLPHMLIIGRDGRIVKVYRGYSEKKLDDIVADINRALQPAP